MVIKKLLNTALATTFVIFSVIGGGADTFVSSSVVFAAEETLAAGTYTVPLIRQWGDTKEGMQKTSPLHFCAQGLLTVDEYGSETLTIGVENWSLYEAFIPRIQGYVNESYQYLPSSIFNQDNSNNFTNFEYESYESLIDTNDSQYEISIQDTKYGEIIIDYETSKAVDVAYVTFELTDYESIFSFSAWLNTPYNGYNTTTENANLTTYPRANYYWANLTFYLDTQNLTDVSEIYNGEADDNLSYFLALASNRYKTGTMASRCTANFAGSAQAKAVFDSSVIEKQENGTYLAKFHVNADGYNNAYFSDFKELTSVTHPFSGEDATSIDDWDLLLTGSFKDLEVNAEGYITITYNSLYEAFIGKYIFFDWKSTTDNNIYYCTPCLTTQPIEELTLYDEMTDSGIYVVTDTSKYPKSAKLQVEKNKEDVYYEVAVEDSNDNSIKTDTVSLNERYSGALYQSASWYTFSIVDENGNVLDDSNKKVDIYVPIKGKFSEVIYNKTIPTNSDNAYYKAISTDEYFHFIAGSSQALNINGMTISILEVTPYSNVHDLTDDGIYTANAFFIKRNTENTPSMADTGLVKKVYIEVKGKEKKMYFHAGIVTSGCYIGDVFCNNVDHQDSDGIVKEDTVSYTDFEMVNDELVGNCVYNAYTEYANVKGGILTLDEDCYNSDNNYYSIAVVAPVMEGLTGTWIAKDKVIKDNTCVQLMFTDLEKCDSSVTIDTVLNKYGYGYQPSALVRKNKQAEIIYNIGENTVNTSTAFAGAKAVLAETNPTSQEIEEAIKALDKVTTDTIPTATATVKGYSLTAKEDFGLHLYLDLGYDAQNDDGASVVFTIDGVEQKPQPVVIDKDDPDSRFVSGCGYEFTLDVPAKAMYDEITAKIVLSDGQEVIGDANLGTYSVAGYLNDYLKNDSNTELNALAKATLNYGAYAEKYFKSKADNISDSAVSKVTADNVKNFASEDTTLEAEGIEFAGASLTLKDKTSINLYFNVTDKFAIVDKDYEFRLFTDPSEPEGTVVKATRYASGSSYYCVTIPDISANNLNEKYYFAVNGQKLWYSPYTYVHAALTKTSAEENADLHNLVKALYLYGEEASKVS